jgi:RHS repeat-associated protein
LLVDNGVQIRYNLNVGRVVLRLDDGYVLPPNIFDIQITAPANTMVQNSIAFASVAVAHDVESVTVNVIAHDDATWALYTNANATQIIPNNEVLLNHGENRVFIRVTAPNGQHRTFTFLINRETERPDVITGLRTVSNQTEIQLWWDRAFEPTVTEYRIYRSLTSASGFARIATINNREIFTFTDRSVQRGVLYYYRVIAVNVSGIASLPSASVLGVTEVIPTPPSLMSILPQSGTTVGRNTVITVRAEDIIGLSSVTLQYNDGSDWVTLERRNVSGTNTTVTFNLSNHVNTLDDGEISIRAVITNWAGLEDGTQTIRIYNLRFTGPSQVQGLTAAPASNSVLLRWSNIPDNDFAFFEIEQRDSVDGAFRRVGTESRQLGFNVTNLAPNSTYWFRVRAYDNLGNPGAYSEIIQATTAEDDVPPRITSIQPAQGFFNNSIPVQVTATDNAEVQNILIEISADNQNWTLADNFIVNPPAASVTVTRNISIGHLPEGPVFVRAFATDTSGNVSSSSNVIEHRILRTPPNAPSGLTVTERASLILIEWQDVIGARSFNIYRSADATDNWALLSQNIRTLGFTDSSAVYGSVYYYRVTAVDAAGNESEFSAIVYGTLAEDTEPPVIRGTDPQNGATVGSNPRIRVSAQDNLALASVHAQYQNPLTGEWIPIGSESANGTTHFAVFTWNNQNVPAGDINVRFFAYDRAGNRSEYFTATYDVRNTLSEVPVLTVTPGDMRIELSIEPMQSSEVTSYRLFRTGATGNTLLATLNADDSLTFTDHHRNPNNVYSYFVEARDRFGNISASVISYGIPINKDSYPPVAVAGFDFNTLTGAETAFDGFASTDNVGIVSYLWDFGDGNTADTMRAVHVFENPGDYTVTLTVMDAAGNYDSNSIKVRAMLPSQVGVLNLQVVNSATNAPLPFALITYNHAGQDMHLTADNNGRVRVVVEINQPEIIEVSSFVRGYVPRESSFKITPNHEANGTIRLEAGDVAVGDVRTRRLTLTEIEALGVDTGDPNNHHIMRFDVELEFRGRPVRVNFYGNGGGGFGWGGSGGSSSGGGWNIGGGGGSGGEPVILPFIIPTEIEDKPIIVFLYFSGSASFLREMFEVSVIIHNTADEQFTLSDNTVTLNLPNGLSLAQTRDGQTMSQQLGSIVGGSSSDAFWVVRGDAAGAYNISVSYRGTLLPFLAPIQATFESQSPLIVNDIEDALTLTFFPARGAFAGGDFPVRYELRNTSDRTLYMVNFSIDGGDEVLIRELEPNESIEGVHVLTLPYISTGNPDYEIYFTLMNVVVRSDINVVVHWTGGQTTSRRASSGQTSISSRKFKNELCNHKGDPVSLITGNLIWQYTDFELHGPQNLSFVRYYNSQCKNDSAMGVGWRHSFYYNLIFDGDTATVIMPNGFEYYFDNFTPVNAAYVRLEAYGNGHVFILHNGTRIVFDADGNVAQITDTFGNETSFTYANGLLQTATSRAGTMTFTHVNGRISSISDGNGRTVRYQHDENGNLTRFTNADGDWLGFVYDDNHNLLEVSDFNRNIYMRNVFENDVVIEQYMSGQGTFYFSYDFDNRVTTFTDQSGRVSRHYYDENYRIIREEDEDGERVQEFVNGLLMWSRDYLGNTIYYEYDAVGNLIGITYPDDTTESFEHNANRMVTRAVSRDGTVTAFTYDNRNNLLTMTDPMGGVRRFTYDSNNNMLTFTDATGATTVFTYDANSNRTSVTDATGNTTRFAYDVFGRLISQTMPMGEVTRFEYTLAGKLIRITHPDGSTERFNVNGNGFNTEMIDPMGGIARITYDALNNPLTVTDRMGNAAAFQYDQSGNITRMTDAMGGTITHGYDNRGRLISTTDANGNTWHFAYDANGRLIQTTSPNNATVTTAFDTMGRLTGITNARNATTRFTYDSMGRVTTITDALNGTETFTHDANGNITSIIDARGNTWAFTYDAEGRLLSTTDPLNSITTLTYDAAGRLIQTTSPTGATQTLTYNANGLLTAVTDALGNTTTMSYNSMGRLTRQTNPDGTSISFVYDRNGRLTQATDENGNTTAYTYDANGNVLTITDALGSVTRFHYDRNNRLAVVTNALGGMTRYTYDAASNLTTITDPMGGITRFAYDALNRVSAITDPLGGVTRYEHDANGNIIRITDAMGGVTRFTFDALDRLISLTDAENHTFTFTYDANGNVITQTDGRGNRVSFNYDALNRLNTVTDQAGETVRHTYDADGHLTRVVNQMGAATSFTHDANGRMTSITDALNNTTAIEYDRMGRVTKITDPLGAITRFAYTSTGQLQTVTDALGGVTRFSYNAVGQLISETNQNGETTRFTHDALGRVTSVTNALNHTERFTYDANNRITTVTDRNGAVTRYAYDLSGNLTSVTDAMDNVTRFEYDRLNRLTRVTGNRDQVTVYEYDGRGLVTKVINATGNAQIYVYDQNGNMISATDEDGYVTTFEYDVRNLINTISYADGRNANFTNNAAGQLVRVTDWTGETTFTLDLLGRITSVNDPNNRTVSYAYDAAGNQTRVSYPDSTAVTRTFDSLSRLTAVQTPEGNFNYTHDPAGRVTAMTMPNGIRETYTHDATGQLLTVSQGSQILDQYTYDPVGNVLSHINGFENQRPTTTTQNEFNALNQLTASTERDTLGNIINQFEFTYDNRGNLIRETDVLNNTAQTYTFDATNRMVRGVNHQGEESVYRYNALGVLTGHNTTDYVVDYTSFVPTVLMEYGEDIIQRHVYGNAGFGLSRISTTLTNANNPTQTETFFIQNDRLGSGRFATDRTGNRVAHTHLDEWGNILNHTNLTFAGSEVNILNTFTNHTYDEILGLYYAQARFYDPTQRRFISADPHWNAHNRTNGLAAIQQSGNLYSYVLNNPLRFTDPLGRYGVEDIMAMAYSEFSHIESSVGQDIVLAFLERAQRRLDAYNRTRNASLPISLADREANLRPIYASAYSAANEALAMASYFRNFTCPEGLEFIGQMNICFCLTPEDIQLYLRARDRIRTDNPNVSDDVVAQILTWTTPVDRSDYLYPPVHYAGFHAARTRIRDGVRVRIENAHIGVDFHPLGSTGNYGSGGTPQNVYAVADGVILGYSHFYRGTHALHIDHNGVLVIYGEITTTLGPGQGDKVIRVRQGQLLGQTQESTLPSLMLHFEAYELTSTFFGANGNYNTEHRGTSGAAGSRYNPTFAFYLPDRCRCNVLNLNK